jgi:copper chaperone CopZ
MPTIKVKGMSCQHCVASVTKALSEIEGIAGCPGKPRKRGSYI